MFSLRNFVTGILVSQSVSAVAVTEDYADLGWLDDLTTKFESTYSTPAGYSASDFPGGYVSSEYFDEDYNLDVEVSDYVEHDDEDFYASDFHNYAPTHGYNDHHNHQPHHEYDAHAKAQELIAKYLWEVPETAEATLTGLNARLEGLHTKFDEVCSQLSYQMQHELNGKLEVGQAGLTSTVHGLQASFAAAEENLTYFKENRIIQSAKAVREETWKMLHQEIKDQHSLRYDKYFDWDTVIDPFMYSFEDAYDKIDTQWVKVLSKVK